VLIKHGCVGARDVPLGSLVDAIIRTVRKLSSQGVANALCGLAHLGGSRDVPECVAALDIAAEREAPQMTAQGASNTIWAYAMLRTAPSAPTWSALAAAVCREARRMDAAGVAYAVWATAALDIDSGLEPDVLRSLDVAAAREACRMDAAALANTLWAFGSGRLGDGGEDRRRAERALVDALDPEARRLNAEGLPKVLRALANLRVRPDRALEGLLDGVLLREIRWLDIGGLLDVLDSIGSLGLCVSRCTSETLWLSRDRLSGSGFHQGS